MNAPDPASAPAPPPKAPPHSHAVKGLWMLAIVVALKAGQALLAPLAVAVVLTLVFATPVRALRRHGVPEVAGAALVVLSLVACMALLSTTLFAPASQWWDRAPQTLAQLGTQIDKVRAAIPGLAPPTKAAAAAASAPALPKGVRVPSTVTTAAAAAAAAAAAVATPPADPVRDRIASEGVVITGAILGRGLMAAIAVAATLILTFFLLASEHWMLSRTVEAVPRRRTRALILGALRSAQRELSRYLWTQLLINAGVGLATGLAMNALGLPNPTLWGAVAAVMNFIPYLGPMMTAGLLFIAGLVSSPPVVSVFAPAGAYLGVHLVESNVVTPYVVGRRLSLSPISVFLSVMLWGWLWGLVGAMMAVPLLVGLRAVCKRHRGLRWLCVYMDGSAQETRSLGALLRPRSRPAVAAEPVHPRVRSMSGPLVRRMAGTGERAPGAEPLAAHPVASDADTIPPIARREPGRARDGERDRGPEAQASPRSGTGVAGHGTR